MKKFIFLLAFCLFSGTICVRPIETYAYTEEEKQMAKEWLSAHGYPPTRSGAEQAYQDYLDGKFDDLLNKGGDDDLDDEPDEKPKKKKKKKDKTTQESKTATEDLLNEIGNSLPKEEASTDETASSDTTEEITTAIAEENSAMEEAEMRDSKEQAKARAEYKKAEEERNRRKWMSLGMIGVASLFVVAGGFFIFFKKKD